MDEEEDDEEAPIETPVVDQVKENKELVKADEKKAEISEKSNLVEMVNEEKLVKVNQNMNKKSKRNASELSPNLDQEREHKKLNEDSGENLTDSESGGDDSYLNSPS